MRTLLKTAVTCLAIGLTSCTPQANDSSWVGAKDLVLTNGNFITMDAEAPFASAIRIRGDRIIAVNDIGPFDDESTDIIDLGGRTVIPGLIDSHAHFLTAALKPGHFIEGAEAATNLEEFLQAVRSQAERVSSLNAFRANLMLPRAVLRNANHRRPARSRARWPAGFLMGKIAALPLRIQPEANAGFATTSHTI